MSLTDAFQGGLLTYLLHSTALVAMAGLADRMLRREAVVARQALWRVALLGGLVTASLQIGLGLQPLAGSWGLGWAQSEAASTRPVAEHAPVAVAFLPAAPAAATPTEGSRGWLAFWLGGFTLVALPLGIAYRRFRTSIASRQEIAEGEVCDRLRAVQRRGGAFFEVRLSESDRLSVPIAFGLVRREICVPTRALLRLTPEQQDSLLAHELAHLVRRDPTWLLLDGVFSAVFFFQPLNWLVRRRLRTLSELACDTWAVATLGDPVALAGCLTEVAGWTRAGVQPVLAASIGGRRSHLGQRIERLLDGSAAAADGHARAWLLAAAVVAAVAWLAPGVSLADRATDTDKGTADSTVTPLDDQPAPAPPNAPVPPRPPRRPVVRKVMPPVPPVPPSERRVAPVPPDHEDDEDVVVFERQERDIEEHARDLAAAVLRNAQPQINALSRDVEKTVKLALEQAQREMARAARDLENGHHGIENAARQLEREQQRLAEAKAQLAEERARLDEERQQLREERDRLRREHDTH
jgi:beta-lactamase regulating signal transducer with metallopeptidase domain